MENENMNSQTVEQPTSNQQTNENQQNQQFQQYQQPYQTYIDPTDHTNEFAPQDVSDNKVFAIMVYIMGIAGVVVGLLASKDSRYLQFHIRQSLKMTVCATLLGIICAILFWTVIIPLACGVCYIILFVLRIIAFFQVCNGKSKEPGIISSLGFLK